MKLKLDLHPIFSESRSIESALQGIIEEAVAKRATEVEIIPGKGSGALKKSVIRFLDRPEIKAQYHRIEKDSDNWGRLFVHFRHERPDGSAKAKASVPTPVVESACACCGDPIASPIPNEDAMDPILIACPWCGSPNRISYRRDRRGALLTRTELDYGA